MASNLRSATKLVLDIANIQSREELDQWCGDIGRKRLYDFVQRIAPGDWEIIKTPQASVRFYYETMLTGYKITK